MKKNIIIVLSLMMFLINCQNENKTEFVDSKLLYINVINPNQRIINQSRCITSPFLGATVIPDYEYRWILKDFENNSLKVIDTSDINVNDWVEFWVAESIWSSEDKSYTEKEFFREYYEKWTKEGRLNFSVKNLKSFNNIDSALVKNENKLFNNIYCYSDNTKESSNFFNHIYFRHGNIVLQTISKEFYLIDKIKLFEQDYGNEYSFKQTTEFNQTNQFTTHKQYNVFKDSVLIEVKTNYKISDEGKIIQLNNLEFEKMNIIR